MPGVVVVDERVLEEIRDEVIGWIGLTEEEIQMAYEEYLNVG